MIQFIIDLESITFEIILNLLDHFFIVPSFELSRNSKLQQIIILNIAREIATLTRLMSFANPRLSVSFERLRLKTITWFSFPWNASTFLTSTTCNKYFTFKTQLIAKYDEFNYSTFSSSPNFDSIRVLCAS